MITRPNNKRIKDNMTLNVNNLFREPLEYKDIFTENDKLKSPTLVTEVLHNKTIFAHSKSFPKVSTIFIYNPEQGIYKEYSENELILIVMKLFKHSNIHVSMYHTKQICEHIRYSLNAELGTPEYDMDHIVF
uniref:Uncharacterized protein n=1 Tax=Treubia lacunosa TaxID=93845 RepID=G4Y9W0_9MARC|nr:hypothetical protein TrlaMp62 [Treubia lacunosa]AEH99757.1 hypothetical protein TrlaMp62 [Treubia lacunosa]